MQIPSVAGQLQSQLIQSAKPQSQTQASKPQLTGPVDADTNSVTADKGQKIDTKA